MAEESDFDYKLDIDKSDYDVGYKRLLYFDYLSNVIDEFLFEKDFNSALDVIKIFKTNIVMWLKENKTLKKKGINKEEIEKGVDECNKKLFLFNSSARFIKNEVGEQLCEVILQVKGKIILLWQENDAYLRKPKDARHVMLR